jgi:hypothetical protein
MKMLSGGMVEKNAAGMVIVLFLAGPLGRQMLFPGLGKGWLNPFSPDQFTWRLAVSRQFSFERSFRVMSVGVQIKIDEGLTMAESLSAKR